MEVDLWKLRAFTYSWYGYVGNKLNERKMFKVLMQIHIKWVKNLLHHATLCSLGGKSFEAGSIFKG